MISKELGKQICNELLRISDDIDVTAIITYPKGEIVTVESRIPITPETPTEHFTFLTIIMRGAVEKLGERYGELSFFWFSFSKGQAILFPARDIVIIIGLKPHAPQETITRVFERVREIKHSIRS